MNIVLRRKPAITASWDNSVPAQNRVEHSNAMPGKMMSILCSHRQLALNQSVTLRPVSIWWKDPLRVVRAMVINEHVGEDSGECKFKSTWLPASRILWFCFEISKSPLLPRAWPRQQNPAPAEVSRNPEAYQTLWALAGVILLNVIAWCP